MREQVQNTVVDFTKGNFIGDEEKMIDFVELTKERFLQSYSYLTEEEYDNTLEIYNKRMVNEMDRKEILINNLVSWVFEHLYSGSETEFKKVLKNNCKFTEEEINKINFLKDELKIDRKEILINNLVNWVFEHLYESNSTELKKVLRDNCEFTEEEINKYVD